MNTKKEDEFKAALYNRDTAVRNTAMIGMAVAIADKDYSRVDIKSHVDRYASIFLIDAAYVENEVLKYRAFKNAANTPKQYIHNFADVLGYPSYYTADDIKNIDDNFDAFRSGYDFVRNES